MARVRNRQAGFTLIEIMFVVAIIAILAAIAIPAFTGESAKGKARAEVSAFFSELGVRQLQYKVDRGTYLVAPACPATPSTTLQSVTACVASGQPWGPNVGPNPADQRLNVQLPMLEAYCSYAITVGAAVGTNNPSGFVFTSPALPWYFILATCEMDGNAGTSTYFTSSVDSTVQSLNEGQ